MLKYTAQTNPRDILKKTLFTLSGRVISKKTKRVKKGDVLLSYTTLPFLTSHNKHEIAHTNYWETTAIVSAFLDEGYNVDIIDNTNRRFTPKKKYTVCVDTANTLYDLKDALPSTCIKIFHATSAHPLFQNAAEYARLYDFYLRRGVSLPTQRHMHTVRGFEYADIFSGILGTFPLSTYRTEGMTVHQIPLSSTHTFEKSYEKDYRSAKKSFLWLGSSGSILKGLDLVLEAFSRMPEYQLHVCGKYLGESEFVNAYHKELFETPSIHSHGFIDLGSELFANIYTQSVGIVFPSASEGCGGSVIAGMHAGLIPIVSKEVGADISDVGIRLDQNTVPEIQKAVRALAQESETDLRNKSMTVWEHARATYTREHFLAHYVNFVKTLSMQH